MSGEAHIARHDAALAELLDLGMAAAREAQARLLAAEDAKAFADLTLAFSRVTRSVRQTMALEAKLRRERKRETIEDASEVRREALGRIDHRKTQVRTAMQRLIWTECEDREAERLIAEVDDLLAEDSLYDDFLHEPVDQHIARIATDLGFERTGPVADEMSPTPTAGDNGEGETRPPSATPAPPFGAHSPANGGFQEARPPDFRSSA